MAKRPSKTKADTDWRTFSKPPRLLTPEQEAALSEGVLAPLLGHVLADPALRFDVRARAASVYYRGSSLMRVSGPADALVAEFDEALRLPRADRSGERLARRDLTSSESVAEAIAELESLRAAVDAGWDESQDRTERLAEQAIAKANAGGDLWNDDFIVIDLEYQYAKRRYDLVAIERSEGVAGPGGFANPRLVFVDLKIAGQNLGGNAGLAAVAGDFVEFAKALGGEHLSRAKAEFADLIGQKTRLGALPSELEFRGFTQDELPGYLVVFADRDDLGSPDADTAVISLHEKVTSRHFPADAVRFAVVGEDAGYAIGTNDAMTYRQFKEWRKRLGQ